MSLSLPRFALAGHGEGGEEEEEEGQGRGTRASSKRKAPARGGKGAGKAAAALDPKEALREAVEAHGACLGALYTTLLVGRLVTFLICMEGGTQQNNHACLQNAGLELFVL